MRNALIRYRVMAYLVGTLLVILMLVGVPLKYFGNDGRLVTWIGIPHGWLYMILLITAFDLGRRAKWSWRRLILIALAGTIPFLSFVAERSATKDVRPKIARLEAGGSRGSDRRIGRRCRRASRGGTNRQLTATSLVKLNTASQRLAHQACVRGGLPLHQLGNLVSDRTITEPVEQPFATAEQDRRDGEVQLVDQPGLPGTAGWSTPRRR